MRKARSKKTKALARSIGTPVLECFLAFYRFVVIIDAVGPQGKVTLLFDGDASGLACTHDVLARLSKRVYAKALYLPEGRQPDQLSKADLKILAR